MKTRCPLCQRLVPKTAQHWCTCGTAMDPQCSRAHQPWCAVNGEDAWIGALEF